MKILLLASSMTFMFSAFAGMSGEKKLFTMEKNYNPENVMQIHTQTDDNCRFVTSKKNSENNYLEFYWIMNHGKEVKEVHSMIRSEIKNRVSFQGINEAKDTFKVKLNDLKELRHDLTDTTMEVTSEIIGGKCIVKSIITLGASSKYRKLALKKTFCDVTTNLLGLPNGCKFIELSGTDAETGEALKVRFNKK